MPQKQSRRVELQALGSFSKLQRRAPVPAPAWGVVAQEREEKISFFHFQFPRSRSVLLRFGCRLRDGVPEPFFFSSAPLRSAPPRSIVGIARGMFFDTEGAERNGAARSSSTGRRRS